MLRLPLLWEGMCIEAPHVCCYFCPLDDSLLIISKATETGGLPAASYFCDCILNYPLCQGTFCLQTWQI